MESRAVMKRFKMILLFLILFLFSKKYFSKNSSDFFSFVNVKLVPDIDFALVVLFAKAFCLVDHCVAGSFLSFSSQSICHLSVEVSSDCLSKSATQLLTTALLILFFSELLHLMFLY